MLAFGEKYIELEMRHSTTVILKISCTFKGWMVLDTDPLPDVITLFLPWLRWSPHRNSSDYLTWLEPFWPERARSKRILKQKLWHDSQTDDCMRWHQDSKGRCAQGSGICPDPWQVRDLGDARPSVHPARLAEAQVEPWVGPVERAQINCSQRGRDCVPPRLVQWRSDVML